MRMIDADALKKAIDFPWLDNTMLGKIINDAPTIDVQVYHARGSKILGNEAEFVIDEANAYRGEEMTREEAIYRLKNTAWLGTDKERTETEQAVDVATEALQKQEHDGCEGCKYTHKDQYEMPCLMCKQSKKDLWERKEP